MSATSPYQSAQAPVTVEIELGGTLYVLQPKLSAMKAINRLAGGYGPLFRQLQAYDVDAFVGVVAAGTGTVGPALKDIERQVYQSDIAELLKPLVRFVNICAFGGRDPDVKKAGDDAGQPDTRDHQQTLDAVTRNLSQSQADAQQTA